jgi:serine/threonine protein kinase/Flp pilus assembly protein TadD
MSLSAGTKLDRYEIVAPIGAGGMGQVYRARDPRLGRDVAVKVMSAELAKDPEWLRRFEQEARATAALSHPNILAVHDVGKTGDVSFIVTELLEGETLREQFQHGRLPIRKTLDLMVQILGGLGAAHARGIVHRDLKPENIFITRQGQAKILDFGLAKVTATADADAADAQPTLVSQPGMVVGTVSYMAPEQARGLAADARSDIFAAGAILYEMLCGERAFRGSTPADTISSILKEEPQSLSRRGIAAPPALQRIVNRCLEKHSADRFQSARDMAFAIESISDAQEPAQVREKPSEKSIAVLPFSNMGGDAEQDYFSDGLAEELINALAGLSGLRVASRTSAFRFRGRDLDIREIGKQLNVETVLEGSVRRAGKRLRITAQLINVADGYNMWSQRYDREMEDIFAIQDEITESIVKTLKPTLLGEQLPAARRHTDNVEAYQLYLKGRHLWQQRMLSPLRASIEYCQQAIAIDPDYALAHAGIADALAIMRVYGFISDQEAHSRAEAAVKRAVELDPGLAETHFADALFTLYSRDDWRSAEKPLREAVRLSPRNAVFHTYLGFFLSGCHQFSEAEHWFEKGIELDPLSPLGYTLSAFGHMLANSHAKALQLCERAVELHADFQIGLLALGIACFHLGQHERSIAVLERLASISGRSAWWLGQLGFVYAKTGRVDDALRIRTELIERSRREYIPSHAPLLVDLGLNDRDRIYQGMQNCIAEPINGFSMEIYVGYFIDELDEDPRFRELFSRLHLVQPRPR